MSVIAQAPRTRSCAWCREPFTVDRVARRWHTYCSDRCRTYSNRKRQADRETEARAALRRRLARERKRAWRERQRGELVDARCSQCNVNVSHTHTILCGSPGCPMALPAQPFVSIFAEGTLGPSIPPARPESAWTRAMRGDAC